MQSDRTRAQSGYIYALAEAKGIRYVGQTKKAPSDRLALHLRQAQSRDNHVHRWIRSLAKPPEIIVLERCHITALNERECWWIGQLREAGCDLCNHTAGGQWGAVDEQARRKIGESYRRHLSDPDNYARFLERVRDPERRRKISEGNRGKKMSEEAIAKIQAGRRRAAQEGRWDPVAVGRTAALKSRLWEKGLSPEARRKSGESQRRIWANYTPEQRQARADAIRRGQERARIARGGDAKP